MWVQIPSKIFFTNVKTEKEWLSGLKRRFAKSLYVFMHIVGSNPSSFVSVNIFNRFCYLFFILKLYFYVLLWLENIQENFKIR